MAQSLDVIWRNLRPFAGGAFLVFLGQSLARTCLSRRSTVASARARHHPDVRNRARKRVRAHRSSARLEIVGSESLGATRPRVLMHRDEADACDACGLPGDYWRVTAMTRRADAKAGAAGRRDRLGMLISPLQLDTAIHADPPAPPSPARFDRGLMSGDPLTDRVILWTRVTTSEEVVAVDWLSRATRR